MGVQSVSKGFKINKKQRKILNRFLNGSIPRHHPHFVLANYIRALITGRSTSNSVKYDIRVLNEIKWNKFYQVFSFGNKKGCICN